MSRKMLGATTALVLAGTLPALADCPIKVGVLHSLSGTMAISETTLKDTMEMLVEQQNAAGGVWAASLKRSLWTPHPTGPCSLKKRANC